MNRSEKEIVDFLVKNDLRLRFLDDEILDRDNKDEIFDFLGDFEIVDCDERKDRRECIETAVVFFKTHEIYIKEVAIGECHYSDVMIDGLPHEINYFVVEEIKTVAYGNDRLI